MSSTSQAPFALSMLLAGALISSAPALADDAESAPSAPPNVPTSGPQPAEGAASQPEATSTVSEPTFKSETSAMRWPNVPLLATGSAVLVGAYLPGVVVAGVRDTEDDNDLYIPVAGPWMMLSSGDEESKGYKTLLVVDGVAQGLGALMLLTSFMIPERVTEHWYLLGSNDLRLAPSRMGTGFGMGAIGHF